jgi:hypothetical protein
MTKEITGRQFVAAFKKATAWHTPVACGAGDGLLITSDGIKATIGMEKDDSAGQPWVTDIDLGEMSTVGSLDGYMRYEGMDVLLASVMGIAAVPALVIGSEAYGNTYDMKPEIIGVFGTLAEQKLTDVVWEYPSVKVHGFKLASEMNKPCTIGFEMICDKLVRDSATNTVGTLATVAPLKGHRLIMNKDTVFRINDQDGAALGAGDVVNPSSFELTVTRPMDSESVAGQDGVTEPDDNGFPVVSLTLKFPRYNEANNAFFSGWAAGTPKKMDITFTGKLISDGEYYTFRLILPHLRIADPEAPLSGPGKIPFTMKLDCVGAAAAPLGMTALTAPLRIEVVNKRTTNPLA